MIKQIFIILFFLTAVSPALADCDLVSEANKTTNLYVDLMKKVKNHETAIELNKVSDQFLKASDYLKNNDPKGCQLYADINKTLQDIAKKL